jgi:RNA polymerase sigma-70 factor (ECF subfamily)
VETGQESDEWLMSQVALGKREPLGTLLRRYANSLLTFIHRMNGDRHRDEELFQEVFLAVWVHSRRYQYPRPFKAWLFGIAVNKCRASYRRHEPETAPPELVVARASVDPSPAEAAIAAETAAMVEQAVARLPTAQRAVVVLRIWNGMSYAEIAQTVERTEDTVRSNMFHALNAMRRYLEPRMR